MADWLPAARPVPSDNRDARPPGTRVELIVLHAISLPPGQYGTGLVDQLFTNCIDCASDPRLADLDGVHVSAHFLIDRAGGLTQYVPLDERAWHAGESHWCGRDRCNDFSVGIELEGVDDAPFEEAQYLTLIELLETLYSRYGLGPDAVTGHQHIAPGRKTDPGRCFDWARIGVDPRPPAERSA